MLSIPHYVILWCLLFTIIGAVWYNVDRRYGVKIYRRWYDLTHKDPLPEGEERGFVYNRSNKARFTAAWVVSTVQSVAVILTTQVNPFVEFIMWIFEVPVTMLGFYLGPYLYRLWQRTDVLFDAMDRLERRVERGEVDVKATAEAASQNIRERLDSVLDGGSAANEPQDAPEPDDEAGDEKVEEKEHAKELEVDPRELMRSYARKRHSQQ